MHAALSFTLAIIHPTVPPPPPPPSATQPLYTAGPCYYYPLSHSTRWKFSGIIRDLRRGKRASSPPLGTYLGLYARKMNAVISRSRFSTMLPDILVYSSSIVSFYILELPDDDYRDNPGLTERTKRVYSVACYPTLFRFRSLSAAFRLLSFPGPRSRFVRQ